MQVKIIETGDMAELKIVDIQSGVDWVGDLIGNHDAIGAAADGKIEYSDESECYQANAATVTWWQGVIGNIERADALREQLRESGLLDEEAISDIQVEAGNLDLEDQAPAEIEAMEAIIADTKTPITGLITALESAISGSGHPGVPGTWSVNSGDGYVQLVWSCEAADVPEMSGDEPWTKWGGNAIIEASGARQPDDSGSEGYTDKYGDEIVSQWVQWSFPDAEE